MNTEQNGYWRNFDNQEHWIMKEIGTPNKFGVQKMGTLVLLVISRNILSPQTKLLGALFYV